MRSSFTFARFRGIELGAHWSWLLVFSFVVLSLAGGVLPQSYPGLSQSAYLSLALLAALLFFASIVLHELGHALVALREGIRIDGITLWVFGGVARLKDAFRSPGGEFRVAIAGPVVSLLLCALFLLLAAIARATGVPDPLAGTMSYLARVNALLVGFNLVPALPLDGGRVLRAWLWHRQGSFAAATAWAARAGSSFGFVLTGIGILGLFTGGPNGGVWLVFLGWFLIGAARGERQSAGAERALDGMHARDAMTPRPAVVEAGTKVDSFLEEVVRGRGHRLYPVVEKGRLCGVLPLARAGAVPTEERGVRSVDEVMIESSDAPTVAAQSELLEVVEVLESGIGAVVLEGDSVVGMLSRSDVRRVVAAEEARGATGTPATRKPGLVTWSVVVVSMAIAAGALYYPPVIAISPGETIDVARDIRISGVPVDRPTGRYLLTSVRITRPNALDALAALLSPSRELAHASSVIPPGIDPDRFNSGQRDLFRESRMVAAAAAARAAGLRVGLEGGGVVVEEVLPDTPAAEVLEPGDVITAVDGRRILEMNDLGSAIGAKPVGTPLELTVERAGSTLEITVESTLLSDARPVIGVMISSRNLEIDLPFDIQFKERAIGGPSAGLAFALAISDMLDSGDYAGGRTIAVTGSIGAAGEVGVVGGVEEKVVAAQDAGAALMLVPSELVRDARGSDLEIVGVGTLGEALRALETRSG